MPPLFSSLEDIHDSTFACIFVYMNYHVTDVYLLFFGSSKSIISSPTLPAVFSTIKPTLPKSDESKNLEKGMTGPLSQLIQILLMSSFFAKMLRLVLLHQKYRHLPVHFSLDIESVWSFSISQRDRRFVKGVVHRRSPLSTIQHHRYCWMCHSSWQRTIMHLTPWNSLGAEIQAFPS